MNGAVVEIWEVAIRGAAPRQVVLVVCREVDLRHHLHLRAFPAHLAGHEAAELLGEVRRVGARAVVQGRGQKRNNVAGLLN